MSQRGNDTRRSESRIGSVIRIIIAFLAAGGGIVALLTYFNPPPPSPTTPVPRPTATPVVCVIAGTVVNEDNNQPLSNVQIAYFRITKDANEYIHGVRSKLATTDAKGKFEANCSSVEKENFPLRLELPRPGWCSILQTNEYVRLGERRTAINLFASDNSLKTIGCR